MTWFPRALAGKSLSFAIAAAALIPAVAVPQQPAAKTVSVVGPVIADIRFEGNRRLSTAELRRVVILPVGTALSAAVIQPELDRLTSAYGNHGGAYIQPSIIEIGRNRVRVIFQVHEGATAYEGPEEAPVPEWFNVYFNNTLVCAAATTGNDLCHMWLNKDGTFIIFDPNGSHRGIWKAGKVRADGRVPLCRYWLKSEFTLPSAVQALQVPGSAPPKAVSAAMKVAGIAERVPAMAAPSAPGAPKSTRLCLTKNFRTTCTVHPDVSKLTPELQRKAALSTVDLRNEEGICYAHGPHKVGDVWYEWDDPLPGQAGLDREMLLQGRQ